MELQDNIDIIRIIDKCDMPDLCYIEAKLKVQMIKLVEIRIKKDIKITRRNPSKSVAIGEYKNCLDKQEIKKAVSTLTLSGYRGNPEGYINAKELIRMLGLE